jgi:hypothetical protein
MLCLSLLLPAAFADERIKELNAYWAEVSRAVKAGDFEGYKATCHPDGVLISGKKKTSYLLAKALEIWKPGINATKAGKVKAAVEFRFSKRWGDARTAHEIGMFRYQHVDEKGVAKTEYIHLEALLVKKDRWLILMENQKSEGTKEEWENLKK